MVSVGIIRYWTSKENMVFWKVSDCQNYPNDVAGHVSVSQNRTLRVIHLIDNILYVIPRSGPLAPVPDFKSIKEGEGIQTSWVPPVPELIFGDVKAAAERNGVESVRIPGYWCDKPGHDLSSKLGPLPGERVAYCIHGGGFITMSAHPSQPPSSIVKGILQHCNSVKRGFSIEYRLSKSEPYQKQGAFPSALIDSLNGYLYLITIGYDPKDIVMIGDSAGGNIALSLVRYLVEYASNSSPSGAKLPLPPGSLILLSPWADLGDSHLFRGTDLSNRRYDYIVGSTDSHAYTRASYCGSLGSDTANTSKYISPASRYIEKVSFNGFPRTFLTAGGSEMLLDQIDTLRDKMERDMGTDNQGLTYHLQPDAVHDWVLFTWHEPERSQTLKEIAAWLS
jgi:acetyl esterase/lipase